MPRRSVSFAEIVRALRETADDAARNVETCEETAARLMPSPGIADMLARQRRRAELVGAAHDLVSALAPVERQVRWLLAAKHLCNRLSRGMR